MPDRFRFAFSSCQNWEQGYYAAYRDLVEQGDIDAFVFLGDYIYEYASGGYADARGRQTGQDFECETVEQYRERYALYHSDTLLQAAHALVPWIITWDDHEVDNDYAGDVSEQDDDVEAFRTRRAAAYQAWYEHMPVRLDPPDGPDYAIYRSFAHGDLVRFHVLDTRQYRSDQQREAPFVAPLGDAVQVRDEALADDSDHTMLGGEQRSWLFESVEQSTAVWDVLAQQVFMFGGNAVAGAEPPVVVVDTWDGYAGERQTVLDALGAAADNLIVLTGDFHSAAVAELRADPFDPSLPVVGAEFMASSISSSFFDDDATVDESRHRCPDRQSPPQVVRLPAWVHGVRGDPRPLARHVSRRGRPVRRGIARHDHRFVGGARRQSPACSRCRDGSAQVPAAVRPRASATLAVEGQRHRVLVGR